MILLVLLRKRQQRRAEPEIQPFVVHLATCISLPETLADTKFYVFFQS